MADFKELLVRTGVGPVHVNRFRTRIEPRAGIVLPSGMDLASKMPSFMDSRTAKVHIESRRWNAYSTLVFRGVAMVRPILGLPPYVRDMLIPDVHTDTVGIKILAKHAFTVQTLKRLFDSRDEHRIRSIMEVKRKIRRASGIIIPIPSLETSPDEAAVELFIDVNHHHFLAGRRSFRMGTAAEFGEKGKHWVFETAAVERYSLEAYRQATEIAMGGANATVAPVWMQMGARVARTYGKIIGSTQQDHTEVANLNMVATNALYRSIADYHVALLPGGGFSGFGGGSSGGGGAGGSW